MYYVYELINLYGTVEYVGYSSRPKVRFFQHTKRKPNPKYPHGRFYGRIDLFLHIVSEYSCKIEALEAEYELQKFWNLRADKERYLGQESYTAKLTNDQVIEIRKLLEKNYTCSSIAKMYGVNRKNISNIKTGRKWSRIK